MIRLRPGSGRICSSEPSGMPGAGRWAGPSCGVGEAAPVDRGRVPAWGPGFGALPTGGVLRAVCNRDGVAARVATGAGARPVPVGGGQRS